MRSARKAFWIAALCGLLLQPALQAHAQQAQKPAVVIALASVDETFADLQYLGNTAGAQQFVGLAQLMAAPYRQALAPDKPIGVIVNFENQMPVVMGFVPVKSLNDLLNVLAQQVGPAQDAGNGIKQLSGANGQALFLKESNGYAYVAQSREQLATLPADPAALLGGERKYNVAVEVNVQSIPREMRDMFLAQLRQGIESAPVQDETQRAIQRQTTENFLRQMTQMFDQGEQLTIGWAIDAEAKSTYLDFQMTARPGTEIAQQMAALANVKTEFGGFLMPAAANLSFTANMSENDQQQAKLAISQLRQSAEKELDEDDDLSPEAKNAAKKVVNLFIDVLVKTIEEGRMDGGAVLTVRNNLLQFAAGVHVADGKQFDDAFRQLVELAKEEQDLPEVSLEYARHKDVVFHTMSLPLPDEDAQKAFGPELNVVVGAGSKSAYFAFGQGSLDLLKEVIDSSAEQGAKATLPSQLIVSLTPLVRFGTQLQDEANPTGDAMLAALNQSQGKDRVLLVAQPIERGLRYRIELEEGVLRMIGAAVIANMQRAQ